MSDNPINVRPAAPLQGVIKEKMKPLVVLNPVTLLPRCPEVLHQAMEQCGLQLNKHGDWSQQTLAACHLPIYYPHWLCLSSSLRGHLHFSGPPAALARLSIKLGAMRSKSSQVFSLRPFVFLN